MRKIQSQLFFMWLTYKPIAIPNGIKYCDLYTVIWIEKSGRIWFLCVKKGHVVTYSEITCSSRVNACTDYWNLIFCILKIEVFKAFVLMHNLFLKDLVFILLMACLRRCEYVQSTAFTQKALIASLPLIIKSLKYPILLSGYSLIGSYKHADW